MRSVHQFAENLRQMGFELSLEDGRLHVKRPVDAEIAPVLADEIRSRASDLVHLLRLEAKLGKVLLNDEADRLRTEAAELGVDLCWQRYELNRPLFSEPPRELDPRDVDFEYGGTGPGEQPDDGEVPFSFAREMEEV